MVLRSEVAALFDRMVDGIARDSLQPHGEAIMRRLERDGFCFLITRNQSSEPTEISVEIVD